MAAKIVFANNKGGVGKTVTVVNLASIIADEHQLRVLAIDFDPQANLTFSFGLAFRSLPVSLIDVFEGRCQLADALINVYPNLDVLPSTPALESVKNSVFLAGHKGKHDIVKRQMRDLDAKYDVILMDTPHSIENLLTLNSMKSADAVVIPVKMGDPFSALGLQQLVESIMQVKRSYENPDVTILGIIGTFFEKDKICRELHDEITKYFQSYLFNTTIKKNVALAHSVKKGLPINRYRKGCSGYKDYRDFAEEFLLRLSKLTPANRKTGEGAVRMAQGGQGGTGGKNTHAATVGGSGRRGQGEQEHFSQGNPAVVPYGKEMIRP